MKLTLSFALWAIAWQAVTASAVVPEPEENADEHLRGLNNCPIHKCCNREEGKVCDPRNKCILDAHCNRDKICAGTPKICAPPAQCKQPGVCDSGTGDCRYANLPNDSPCVPDDKCATLAECHDGNCVVGAVKSCHPPPTQCMYTTGCDPLTGDCIYANRPNGEPCVHEDKCVADPTCQDGKCVAFMGINCDPPSPCQKFIRCDSPTGNCIFENVPDGTPCDDGNSATPGDVCIAGVCTCTAGPCCGKADGTPCKTGDKCLKDAKCENQVCKGRTKLCTPPTQCKMSVGGCNPSNGKCTFVNKPDDTPCNDHNKATKIDLCKSGFCVGL